MKTILILRRFITGFYYLLALGVIIKIIKTVSYSFSSSNFKSNLFGLEVDFSNFGPIKSFVILMMPLILLYLFFRAIHLLKYSLDDLEKDDFFTPILVSDFKKIGVLFIACSLGELVASLITRLIVNSQFNLKLNTSIVLFFIMGLFFMFLSEVFEKARTLQQENDLTI